MSRLPEEAKVTPALSSDCKSKLLISPDFVAAATSKSRVTNCPHNLYKYPARFAPEFAREVIRAFSRPGDIILDVFQGGGTSVIEAIALGRRAIGYDISQLACFLARTKTTPLSVHDGRALLRWAEEISNHAIPAAAMNWEEFDTDDGYYRRNLPHHALAFFTEIIARLDRLNNNRQRNFARLILLAVGQWALDCKKRIPATAAMRAEFYRQITTNVRAFHAYTWKVSKELGIRNTALASRRKIIRASSERCGDDEPLEKASLIVTSPPYPGVHMLYHRWQILGRRETPALFAIANCRDGDGISFYNLGHRSEVGLKTYYDRLTKVFMAARKRLKDEALVVQMVAFNQPEWQLPAFLHAMEDAGYRQVMPELPAKLHIDGNLWRAVPGRRWYAATRKSGDAGKEVVLFHRPSKT
jgi:DNA modification methylase